MDGPVAQQRYLTGIEWPAMKETVVAALQRNGAPNDLIDIVQRDPMTRFVSVASVSQAWWNAAPPPSASRFNWGGRGTRDRNAYSART